MDNNQILILRDDAKNKLAEIKTVEDGINYLNKLAAIEIWVKAEKKDAELQNIVAEQKLRTQRILGELIADGQKRGEIAERGESKYNSLVTDNDKRTLPELGIDNRNNASNWKKIASIPAYDFEKFIEEKKSAVDGAVAELTTAGALRLAKGAHVSNNSGENEWYTPGEYTEAARSVMGSIDLDPASTPFANEHIKAKKIFTEKEDGTQQKWFGNIWMNPPYSQPLINDFIDKLETESFNQAIVLVNNATETKWGQKLLSLSNAVCFPEKRIRFINPELNSASPLQGQMICYIGSNYKSFIKEFRPFGICLKREV